MDDTRLASDNLWNPATNLFEVAVFRRHGPPLIVKNLPLPTADRLRNKLIDALRERRSVQGAALCELSRIPVPRTPRVSRGRGPSKRLRLGQPFLGEAVEVL